MIILLHLLLQGDTYHHKQSMFLQYFEIQDMPSNPVKNKVRFCLKF